MKKKALFITATDTTAGKTLIAAGLCRALRTSGLDVGCCKPIATGETVSGDARLLMVASGTTDLIEVVNPYLFRQPLAPYRAAKLDKKKINMSCLIKHIQKIVAAHDITIIEGAGGLMVPITAQHMMLDLMAELGYPVLLVSPAKLGTINHTLLSVQALRNRSIKTRGIIMNQLNDSKAATSSCQEISRLSPVPIIAKIRYNISYQKNLDLIAEELAKQIDIKRIADSR